MLFDRSKSSNFRNKQLYVVYKPAASVRDRYKLIHVRQEKLSRRIFLSLDIVSFCFYTKTAGKHETWTKHKRLR